MSDIHEECGVFGVYSNKKIKIANIVYYGLYALQHRGQEGCGISVCSDWNFTSYKDVGLVSDVFSKDIIEDFPCGSMAAGHVRYSTTGKNERINCQPIEVNHRMGKLAISHNGNLSNAYELRSALEMSGAIFHTTSDTEIIAYIITHERLTSPSVEAALISAMYKLDGAYSLVVMSEDKLLAARDKYGFRPLCYGKREDGSFVIASESCALEAVGAEFVRDVLPGEVVSFDKSGVHSYTAHCAKTKKSSCIFEYIYFSRPDSVIDGASVHEARLRAGRILAECFPVDADVVIGVPDSGIDAAIGYAQQSKITYGLGFIKNKYIGRTFISPQQNDRENKVRIKLSVIKKIVEGKRVVLIDDSIVRGTTSGQIVKLLREAGAKEIHMRISAPPFLKPCYYGTDIDSCENLIACKHSAEEIAEILGADSLSFLPIEKLRDLIDDDGYCSACFGGEYPTAISPHINKSGLEN